jgi:hypothetical protein
MGLYSKRQFTPGKKSNARRMIDNAFAYTSEYNRLNIHSNKLNCLCIPDRYDKNTVGSDSPSIKVSNNMRIAQVITSAGLGGKLEYGSFYLCQPLQVNYLGRVQGMPGGSGSPPRNKFN